MHAPLVYIDHYDAAGGVATRDGFAHRHAAFVTESNDDNMIFHTGTKTARAPFLNHVLQHELVGGTDK